MIVRTHYELGQTALRIICDERYLPIVKDAVHSARSIIENKIAEDPFFGTTFEPYPPLKDDHLLVQHMCQASVLSNVGPMAGVAGAIAKYAVDAAIENGCDHIIIDNGGDICMRTSETTIIGVFSGDDKFKDIAFSIPPTDRVFSICSSSGKVGPSVSFGNSGICTVFSNDPVLADCCATAFGNMIREGTSEEMSQASEDIASIDDVSGCVCVSNGLIAMRGDIPEMVSVSSTESNVTKILFPHI